MGREQIVRGHPNIKPTGELYKARLAGKQRRAPFSQQEKFGAVEPSSWCNMIAAA
jgi:hypothetical protein